MKDNTKNQRDLLKRLEEVCEELGEHDGVDPRLLARRRHRQPRKAWRKRAQLCKQVELAVHDFWLDLDDLDLLQMHVEHVRPNPDTSHLCVVLRCSPPDHEEVLDMRQIEARLTLLAPAVRGYVSSRIHRKRAPFLSFEVLPHE